MQVVPGHERKHIQDTMHFNFANSNIEERNYKTIIVFHILSTYRRYHQKDSA